MKTFITPHWPAARNVRALCSTRNGGCSKPPWDSLNLGLRCGDDRTAVLRNREILCTGLPALPQWLNQVHGASAVVHPGQAGPEIEADALVSFGVNEVCAVLTADCLPVFLCDRSGSRVAIAHGGWRGLARGVLQATVAALEVDPEYLMAWFGPAIGPNHYEVGDDVRDAFPVDADLCFRKRGDRWLLDLYLLSRRILARSGVHTVSGGDRCTFSEPRQFFSFRRDGVTGRMASLIWRE